MANIYYPVNECIYCGELGSEDNPLTDEHIIPFGLNGNHILPKATCQRCAAITSHFELKCLREAFGLYRSQKQYRSRKKSHKQRATLINRDRKGNIQRAECDVMEAPRVVAFPVYPAPGIVTGNDPCHDIPNNLLVKVLIDGRPPFQKGVNEVGMKLSVTPLPLARMLAKIGYGFAVTTFDHSVRKKWRDYCFQQLRDINLNPSIKPWHLVGCDYSNALVRSEINDRFHAIQFIRITRKPETDLAAIRIKLFADLDGPIYLGKR